MEERMAQGFEGRVLMPVLIRVTKIKDSCTGFLSLKDEIHMDFHYIRMNFNAFLVILSTQVPHVFTGL